MNSDDIFGLTIAFCLCFFFFQLTTCEKERAIMAKGYHQEIDPTTKRILLIKNPIEKTPEMEQQK